MTLPTWITLARLGAIPLILWGLAQGSLTGRWVALIAFGVGSLTDWLDGYLARRLHQTSELGKFLDPLVDKLLVMAPLLALLEQARIPAWGVFLILGREITIAGWRVNQTQISGANLWGKAKTVTQMAALVVLMGEWPGGIPLFWLAVVLTLISGLTYVLPIVPKAAEAEQQPNSLG
ncbi:MAG: CDP-diacylglycerol--glycerol-3-phosphate 3-phosphatidyltransferase [Synechococcaceae cyanobacterium SM2_3_2]|nr:CDP-diacylglycerol--glycerol-3-phosphate 3-phosphatidyltransferase [Synechococcaceae cyanobacterium SM2_3_2]